MVVLDQQSGEVRELQIDEATAKQVQDGKLTPEQLVAMFAAQEQAGSGSDDKAS